MYQNQTEQYLKDMATSNENISSSISDMQSYLNNKNGNVSNTLGDLQNQLGDLSTDVLESLTSGLTSSNILSVNLSSIKNSFQDTSSMFNNITKEIDNKLSDTLSLVDSARSKTDTALDDATKALTKLSESRENGLIFTTSNNKSGILDGVLDSANSFMDSLSGLGSGTIGKITDLASGSLSNAVDAVKSVSSKITSTVSGVYTKGMELAQDITSPVTNLINNVSSSFNGGIQDINNLTNSLSTTISNTIPFIPTDLIKDLQISGFSLDSYMNSQMNSIIQKVPNLSNISSLTDLYSKFGNQIYPAMTDSTGSPVWDTGTYTLSQITNLVSSVSPICGTVGLPGDIKDFSINKDIFDLSLLDALDKNMLDLVEQMLTCGTYPDERTMNILKDKLPSSFTTGNSRLADIITNVIGISTVSDPKSSMTTLLANTKDYSSNEKYIGSLKVKLNTTDNDIIESEGVLDATKVAFLSINNLEYVNTVIPDSNTRDTIYSVLTAYAS